MLCDVLGFPARASPHTPLSLQSNLNDSQSQAAMLLSRTRQPASRTPLAAHARTRKDSQKHARTRKGSQGLANARKASQGSARMHKDAQGCTRMHKDAQGCCEAPAMQARLTTSKPLDQLQKRTIRRLTRLTKGYRLRNITSKQ